MISKHCRHVEQLLGLNPAGKKREKWTFEDLTLDGATGARLAFQSCLIGATDDFRGPNSGNIFALVFLIIVSLLLLLSAY